MRLVFGLLSFLLVIASKIYSFVMVDDRLVIDFSPSTTNLLYGLVNATIRQNPFKLLLTSSYGQFKITNIELPNTESNEKFCFDFVSVSCDLKPNTTLNIDVFNSESGFLIAKQTISFPQTYGIIELRNVSKNVSSINLIFSYNTTYPNGGEVNTILVAKSFVLENAINDNDIIVYPNPFIKSPNGIVNISFKLTSVFKVSIVIFDSKGNVIKSILKDQEFQDGIYTFAWDLKDDGGKDVNSGTYIVFAKIGDFSVTKKLYIVR